jgi:hypothetical protein
MIKNVIAKSAFQRIEAIGEYTFRLSDCFISLMANSQ